MRRWRGPSSSARVPVVFAVRGGSSVVVWLLLAGHVVPGVVLSGLVLLVVSPVVAVLLFAVSAAVDGGGVGGGVGGAAASGDGDGVGDLLRCSAGRFDRERDGRVVAAGGEGVAAGAGQCGAGAGPSGAAERNGVSPVGRVSVTVTVVPSVEPVPLLVTVIE